ncbi:MAG TPA: alpha/beta hydrolase [Clostridiales bacterium]|nr:alpha/beta hydrolase [Clostridiales bacterium]
MKVLLIILLVVVVCAAGGAICYATLFKKNKEKIKPYGQMVPVYDGQMHLYHMGSGQDTIVLLAGMGISLPCADFGPLMRALSKKYTVVCVEYFGVGFSTLTKRERTCDHYTEEIRTALRAAGFKTPYIFMPHSMSGVYCEYFASKYPDEVKAIISLDSTSTAYIGMDMPGSLKSLLNAAKIQQAIGFNSIWAVIGTNRKKLASYSYTRKEINDLIIYAGFAINDNSLEQIARSTEYIKETNQLVYPDTVPYLKFISGQTYETKNFQIKQSPADYQKEHLARVKAESNYEVLEGNHFIYLNNENRILELTEAFLRKGIKQIE